MLVEAWQAKLVRSMELQDSTPFQFHEGQHQRAIDYFGEQLKRQASTTTVTSQCTWRERCGNAGKHIYRSRYTSV